MIREEDILKKFECSWNVKVNLEDIIHYNVRGNVWINLFFEVEDFKGSMIWEGTLRDFIDIMCDLNKCEDKVFKTLYYPNRQGPNINCYDGYISRTIRIGPSFFEYGEVLQKIYGDDISGLTTCLSQEFNRLCDTVSKEKV